MATLKKTDSATSIVFRDGTYIDKLFARNVFVDERNPSDLILEVDFLHYSKRRRNNLEDSDFMRLEKGINDITKLTLRDDTIAKKILLYAQTSVVEIKIGSTISKRYTVLNQISDHHDVSFDF